MALRFAKNEKVGNGFIDLTQVEADDGLSFLLLNGRDNGFEQLAGACDSDGRLFACLKGCDDFLQMKFLMVVLVNNFRPCHLSKIRIFCCRNRTQGLMPKC